MIDSIFSRLNFGKHSHEVEFCFHTCHQFAFAVRFSGENYKTDGYVITPKTMQLLEEHFKAVNGMVIIVLSCVSQ